MHAGLGHGWPQSLGFRLGQSSEECDVVISLYSADWPFVIFKVLTGEHREVSQDNVQHCSWVTDFRVTKQHVYKLMRGGRARWKIENETCNTLKNQGYNFDHNYGHGEQHLSVVLAMLMMLALLVDQTQQRCCALFQAVWAKLGSKRLLWERIRALFFDDALESMRQLLEALFYGLKKSAPLFADDSS